MRFTFRECSNLSKVGELSNSLQNMMHTFQGTGIISMPVIPDSVNNMYGTFTGCANLITTTTLPEGIEDLSKTFQNCVLIEHAPSIPKGVKIMVNTFYSCTSLKIAPAIPNTVEVMSSTFYQCTSLEKASTIPSSVKRIEDIYRECPKLRGNIEINASVTGALADGEKVDYWRALYDSTEEGLTLTVSGTCEFIDEIIAQAANPRITKATTETT